MVRKYRGVGQFIIFSILLVLFIAVVHSFILPVILGLIISVVFRPIYNWLCNVLGERIHLASAISTVLITLCVIVPLSVATFFLVRDVSSLIRTISDLNAGNGQALMQTPLASSTYKVINRIYPIDPADYETRLRDALTAGVAAGKSFVGAFAATVPRKVLMLVFFLIAFYFGLVDGKRLLEFLRSNLPFSGTEETQLFGAIHNTIRAVVVGAVMVGLVQGTIIGLSYWVLGIPRPFIFAILTAIFSFVPLVGCGPTGLGGVIYLIANARVGAAIVMLACFGLTSISDNIVRPWVLKGKVQLHPLLGLLSVLGGMRLFGVSGLFLGPVITSSFLVLIQLLQHRLKVRDTKDPE